MNTLTETELNQIAGSGDPVVPVSTWPTPTYSPSVPVLPGVQPGNSSPRHVDN